MAGGPFLVLLCGLLFLIAPTLLSFSGELERESTTGRKEFQDGRNKNWSSEGETAVNSRNGIMTAAWVAVCPNASFSSPTIVQRASEQHFEVPEWNKSIRRVCYSFPSADSWWHSGVSHMANGRYDGCTRHYWCGDASALSPMDAPRALPDTASYFKKVLFCFCFFYFYSLLLSKVALTWAGHSAVRGVILFKTSILGSIENLRFNIQTVTSHDTQRKKRSVMIFS